MSNVTKDEQEVDSAEFARILTKQVNLADVGLHAAHPVEPASVVGKSLFRVREERGLEGEGRGREKTRPQKAATVIARERSSPAPADVSLQARKGIASVTVRALCARTLCT